LLASWPGSLPDFGAAERWHPPPISQIANIATKLAHAFIIVSSFATDSSTGFLNGLNHRLFRGWKQSFRTPNPDNKKT
jgi:hypothetical protein